MPRYKYTPKKVKIKVTKLKIIAFLIAAISFCVVYLEYPAIYKTLVPIKQINYYGVPLVFRQDLKQASTIPVYPNENALKIFYDPKIKTIYIAFRNTTQNSLVEVEAYEISYKLKIFYLLAKHPITIKGINVTSYKINGNSTSPVIVLIPPVDANETAVKVSSYTIYIGGKNLHDFDLATEKFLMVVLGIKV